MKLVGLFVTLGIIAMLALTLMLGTISADASAEWSSASKDFPHDVNSALAPTAASASLPNVVALASKPDAPAAQTNVEVVIARKRPNSRCARVTTTCWGSV